MNRNNGEPTVHVSRDRYGYKVDGTFYRRVTTHLNGIPKPWLGGWAAKEVAEFAVSHREQWLDLPETDAKKLLKGAPWSKRDDAADRGSAVHAAIEAYLTDAELPDMNEEEFDCAVAAEQFMERFVGQVLAAELTIYNPEHEYAGTLDLWCVDQEGNRWILDWKTSKDVYADHAVQQVAYRMGSYAVVEKSEVGDEEWEGRRIPWGPGRAENLGIVHVTPERATLHRILPDQHERLWRAFRAAKYLKAWQSDTDDYRGDPKVQTYEQAMTVNPNEPEPAPATA